MMMINNWAFFGGHPGNNQQVGFKTMEILDDCKGPSLVFRIPETTSRSDSRP